MLSRYGRKWRIGGPCFAFVLWNETVEKIEPGVCGQSFVNLLEEVPVEPTEEVEHVGVWGGRTPPPICSSVEQEKFKPQQITNH